MKKVLKILAAMGGVLVLLLAACTLNHRIQLKREEPLCSPFTKLVTVDGEEVNLTPIEFNILNLFLRHPGQVFSTAQIYEQVWHDQAYGAENTVAVHIRHLREKIEIDPANPRYIKVVWGLGYKMEKI